MTAEPKPFDPQAGILEIVAVEPDWNDSKWSSDFAMVRELLNEAGVMCRFLSGRMAPESP